jgi:GntR family transcriptional regulator/MocR family aminotransferase
MDYKVLFASYSRHHETAAMPRQRAIHGCLRAAIVGGQLAPGTRLLASRMLAAELGIARNTVLYAYDQLAGEGLVTATPRGTVVAALALPPAPTPAKAAGPVPAAGAGRDAIARRMRGVRALPAAGRETGAFVPGMPALDEFPLAVWRRSVERAWRTMRSRDLDYIDAAGLLPLREALSAHLGASRGVRCGPGQVFITSGTQASLELCARLFADAGDTAWIEHPGYQGALAAFRGAQLRTIGIPVDSDGMHATSADWRKHPPRLIYTTPSHQYPTGTVLAMPRRLALIAQARTAGALIIEDDYDSEFRYDGPPLPAMQGLAADAPVIYLGTFSKTMFPSLRTGYMVVPAHLADAVRAVLARSVPHGRAADQLALADFLHNGRFGMHLRRMRRLYRARRDILLECLQRELGDAVAIHGSSAGIHLSLQLADPALDDNAVAAAALEQGVVARALSAHATALRPHGWNGLLLGYAQVDGAAIAGLVKTLASVIAQR